MFKPAEGLILSKFIDVLTKEHRREPVQPQTQEK